MEELNVSVTVKWDRGHAHDLPWSSTVTLETSLPFKARCTISKSFPQLREWHFLSPAARWYSPLKPSGRTREDLPTDVFQLALSYLEECATDPLTLVLVASELEARLTSAVAAVEGVYAEAQHKPANKAQVRAWYSRVLGVTQRLTGPVKL